jgi:hypothetical protein
MRRPWGATDVSSLLAGVPALVYNRRFHHDGDESCSGTDDRKDGSCVSASLKTIVPSISNR